MPVRKLSANYVFDGRDRLVKNGILSINSEGVILDLSGPAPGDREQAGVAFYNGIITPGFINTHCHLELSHLEGMISPGGGLEKFIEGVIRNRNADPEQIARAMQKADQAMKKEGIVAVGDISNNDGSFPVKAGSPVFYRTFIELFGLANGEALTIYNRGKELMNTAVQTYGLEASLTPHSAYAVSDELFRLIVEDPDNNGRLFSVHSQETPAEDEFIRASRGPLYDLYTNAGMNMSDVRPRRKRVLEHLAGMFSSNDRLLLIHNVCTTEEDIERAGLDYANTWWSLCPASNKYITGLEPPAFLFDRFPGKITIGTDSLASNYRLSVLDELKLLQEQRPGISLAVLLRAACLNGAEALGLDGTLGSFDKGKMPGVNLIRKADLQNLRLRGETDVKVLA